MIVARVQTLTLTRSGVLASGQLLSRTLLVDVHAQHLPLMSMYPFISDLALAKSVAVGKTSELFDH